MRTPFLAVLGALTPVSLAVAKAVADQEPDVRLASMGNDTLAIEAGGALMIPAVASQPLTLLLVSLFGVIWLSRRRSI